MNKLMVLFNQGTGKKTNSLDTRSYVGTVYSTI